MTGRSGPTAGPGPPPLLDTPAGGPAATGADGCWWQVGVGAGRRRRTPPEATNAEYIGGPESVSNTWPRGAPGSRISWKVARRSGRRVLLLGLLLTAEERIGLVAVLGRGRTRALPQEWVDVAILVARAVATGDLCRKSQTGGLVVALAGPPVVEERVVLGLAETLQGLAGEGLEGRLPLSRLAGLDVGRCPGAGRDELADDDVLLEPDQVVLGAIDGRLGQHPGGLLEGRRGKER